MLGNADAQIFLIRWYRVVEFLKNWNGNGFINIARLRAYVNFFCACSEKRAVSVSSAMRALAMSVEVRSTKMLRVFRCTRLCQPARQAGAQQSLTNTSSQTPEQASKPFGSSKPRAVEQHKHKHKDGRRYCWWWAAWRAQCRSSRASAGTPACLWWCPQTASDAYRSAVHKVGPSSELTHFTRIL